MKNVIPFLTLCIVGFILSCNSNEYEDVKATSDGTEYISLEEGKYVEYKYDTIFYKGFKRDTFSGFIKKEIGEQFENATGTKTNKLFVYWKRNKADAYTLHRVETVRIENNLLIESDNGLNFIKLTFPLSENKGWLGNSLFNTSEDIIELVYGEPISVIERNSEWNYRVDAINEEKTIGDLYFSNTTTINQVADTLSTVKERLVFESYAEGVGLINKYMVVLSSTASVTAPLIVAADKGFVMNLEIIDNN